MIEFIVTPMFNMKNAPVELATHQSFTQLQTMVQAFSKKPRGKDILQTNGGVSPLHSSHLPPKDHSRNYEA